eukprot:2864954-Alexandrium_andersonii.AAC.1
MRSIANCLRRACLFRHPRRKSGRGYRALARFFQALGATHLNRPPSPLALASHPTHLERGTR